MIRVFAGQFIEFVVGDIGPPVGGPISFEVQKASKHKGCWLF
ncbi:hypothetical protein [Paenibacillus andongensis]|nr:hypothetical protein [Paenibacillus andongensis]